MKPDKEWVAIETCQKANQVMTGIVVGGEPTFKTKEGACKVEWDAWNEKEDKRAKRAALKAAEKAFTDQCKGGDSFGRELMLVCYNDTIKSCVRRAQNHPESIIRCNCGCVSKRDALRQLGGGYY